MNIPTALPFSPELGSEYQQALQQRLRALGERTGPTQVSQNYTFQDNDTIDSLQVDATAGNVTITLPSPTGNRRRRVIKTDSSANTVTIQGTNGEFINGETTVTLLRPYRSITVEPTGTGWFVVGGGAGVLTYQGGFIAGQSVLATTATSGFLHVPTCAGTPTGVPNTTFYAPIVVDTTNNKLYFYSSGAWRDAGP